MKNESYLASKPRYEILDGLRGVAAMFVVLFHILETYSKGPAYHPLNHGYLGVDFFFVLSGFVIGYAYDDRWDHMTTWDFFKRRIVRLHPLVILGCLFGLFMFYFTDTPMFPLVNETPVWKLLIMSLLAFLMIPALTQWDIRGWNETNALNNPTWSLMWEYIANILYALFIRKFSTKMLIFLIFVFALLNVNLTMNLDFFGVWDERTAEAYTVIGGWSVTPDHIVIGATRLLYPFFIGLLLSRIGKHIKIRAGFWVCSLLVAGVMWMPRIGGEAAPWMNGIYETIAILFILPLIVNIGAGSQVSGRNSIWWCKFLGEISYPLYIMHYPFIYLQLKWASEHSDSPLSMHIFVGISVFMLAIGVAYASLKVYDIPVREWLSNKYLRRKGSKRISEKQIELQ
ncbi:MAG: acyltransferase [Muribaculum sp.]|nr:acyltransferase [Muribaculum sp.]